MYLQSGHLATPKSYPAKSRHHRPLRTHTFDPPWLSAIKAPAAVGMVSILRGMGTTRSVSAVSTGSQSRLVLAMERKTFELAALLRNVLNQNCTQVPNDAESALEILRERAQRAPPTPLSRPPSVHSFSHTSSLNPRTILTVSPASMPDSLTCPLARSSFVLTLCTDIMCVRRTRLALSRECPRGTP